MCMCVCNVHIYIYIYHTMHICYIKILLMNNTHINAFHLATQVSSHCYYSLNMEQRQNDTCVDLCGSTKWKVLNIIITLYLNTKIRARQMHTYHREQTS